MPASPAGAPAAQAEMPSAEQRCLAPCRGQLVPTYVLTRPPGPLVGKASSKGAAATRRPAGHHGASGTQNFAPYRSQKALRLLNSAVASQEPHEHHDSSDRNQDVDSCKGEREAEVLPESFARRHPSAWPGTLGPRGGSLWACRIEEIPAEVAADTAEQHNIHESGLKAFEAADTETLKTPSSPKSEEMQRAQAVIGKGCSRQDRGFTASSKP